VGDDSRGKERTMDYRIKNIDDAISACVLACLKVENTLRKALEYKWKLPSGVDSENDLIVGAESARMCANTIEENRENLRKTPLNHLPQSVYKWLGNIAFSNGVSRDFGLIDEDTFRGSCSAIRTCQKSIGQNLYKANAPSQKSHLN
jgi:hypothetical protein